MCQHFSPDLRLVFIPEPSTQRSASQFICLPQFIFRPVLKIQPKLLCFSLFCEHFEFINLQDVFTPAISCQRARICWNSVDWQGVMSPMPSDSMVLCVWCGVPQRELCGTRGPSFKHVLWSLFQGVALVQSFNLIRKRHIRF